MVCIVDYGVGNLASVKNMFKRAGITSVITSNAAEIENASKILLPGMGHFDNCMNRFNDSGLRTLIEKRVLTGNIPLLGICVGMQMLMESSEEGSEAGLGWIKGKVIRFDSSRMDSIQKIPNMGWLEVDFCKESDIKEGLSHSRFYFAHSYHVLPEDQSVILIEAKYGYKFCAAIEKNNLLGVQFHPEKSHRFGMQLLKNFANNY